MTRFISVFMTALLVISLCGCNKKSENITSNVILNKILEVDEGQYSNELALTPKNLVSIDPIYAADDSVHSSTTITLNKFNLNLSYKDTVYYPLSDRQSNRYYVDGDESKIIELDMSGNINWIRYKYTTLDISKTATPEEVLSKLRPQLEKIRSLSQYEFVELLGTVEINNGFGYYCYLFYNMEDDYITNYLSVRVYDDGGVSSLRIYELPAREYKLNVNEDKLNDIIEAKLKNTYDTDNTKYSSFDIWGEWFYLTVYKGEYYLECGVAPKYIKSGVEESGYLTTLLVPLDLVSN